MSRNLAQEINGMRTALKGSGPQTSANSGGPLLIAGRSFTKLMDETASVSQWLGKGMRLVPVETGQETIELQDFGDQYWTGVDPSTEGDPNTEGRVTPDSREVSVATGHYVFEVATTRKAARRIKAKTGSDLIAVTDEGFKRQLGNNFARTAILGDLNSTDPSLNQSDGLVVRAQRGEITVIDLSDNVGGVAVARAFDPDTVFHRASDELPEAFQGNCRWYGNKKLWSRYARWLSNSGTTERMRDAMAADALTQQMAPGPLGYPLLSVPQWPTTDGASGTPDAIVLPGGGVIRARVNVVLPDTNSYAGRRVRLTLIANAAFEDCTVYRNGGQNLIQTTGALAQAVISGNAAAYTVKVIDESSVMLTDPNNCLLIVEDKLRVYRQFDGRSETLSRMVHADMGGQFLKPEAGVLITGFYLQQIA